MPLDLFINIPKDDWFHFYDQPDRHLMKTDDSHYLTPTGSFRPMHPYVAVVPEGQPESSEPRKSIYDQTKE